MFSFQYLRQRCRPLVEGCGVGAHGRHQAILLVWMISLLGGISAIAQTSGTPIDRRYFIRHWNSEHGLPTGQISCIHQTPDGFLWLGTKMALVRFDGLKFIVYERNSTPELLNSEILCMVSDAARGFWMGTGGGLAHRGEHGFSFYSGPFPVRSRSVTAVAPGRSGALWVGNQGQLYKVEPHLNIWTLVTDASFQRRRQISSILEEPDGTLWVGTEVSVQRRGPGETQFNEVWFNDLNPDPVTDLRLHSGKRVTWSTFSTWFEWSEEDLHTHPWEHLANRYPRTPYTLEGHDGSLFYCGESVGFGVLDGQKPQRAPLLLPEGIRFVRAALQTRDGSLWLGTSGQGLYQFIPHYFESLREQDGLPCEDVRSIWTRDGRELWLASHRGLTLWKEGDLGMHVSPSSASGSRTLYSVLKDREGRVWAGGKHLHEVKEGALRRVVVESSQLGAPGSARDKTGGPRDVRGLHEEADGTIWAGASDGLYQLSNGVWRVFGEEEGLKGLGILGAQRDASGILWVGTTIGRIWRFDGSRFIGFQQEPRALPLTLEQALSQSTKTGMLLLESAIPEGYVGPVLMEEDGTVWFGSASGLLCFRKGEFRRLTIEHGLAENAVLNLLTDGLGYYWTSGHQGVHRFRKADVEAVLNGQQSRFSVRTFGLVDGLPSVEGNGGSWPSAAKSDDGRLWFLTIKGLAAISPLNLPSMDSPCTASLESVRADGEVLVSNIPITEQTRSGRSGSTNTVNAVQMPGRDSGQFQLAAGRGRVLEFHFSSAEFRHPSQIRVQYQLQGQDQGWVDASGNQRVAYYTNLRPGDYQFKLRAARPGAEWPSEAATFSFSISPHYWQRPLVYVCSIALFMIGVVALFRYRLHLRLKILRLEQANALENERIRIARDMHDTLGARLSQIALVSTHRNNASQVTLAEVAVLAREAMRDLRELIWVVNPQNDSLPRFAEFVSQYSESFLAPAGIRTRLDIPLDLPEVGIPSSLRHGLALVLKEALNNILRHAAASEVHIQMRLHTLPQNGVAHLGAEKSDSTGEPGAVMPVNDPYLLLEITDNGVGFDPSDPRPNPRAGRGHGLINMQERIQALHGTLQIISRYGGGTILRIATPLPIPTPSPTPTKPISVKE